MTTGPWHNCDILLICIKKKKRKRNINNNLAILPSQVPFVLGPEFAMARIPAPVNLRSGWISSSLWSHTHIYVHISL